MWFPLSCTSRDKAYVPGAKPKADMEQLNNELLELVESLRPKPEECQRQWYTPCSRTLHPVSKLLLHAAISQTLLALRSVTGWIAEHWLVLLLSLLVACS